jgi:hypothetical protein
MNEVVIIEENSDNRLARMVENLQYKELLKVLDDLAGKRAL